MVWVFHAISGHTDVLAWWPDLFGKGKLYDPDTHYIVCANCIGSPFGSTRPMDSSFPNITVRDQVQAYILLAEHLGLDRIHTVIGGSFGGYQALEFAYTYAGQIDHMILLASSARESAWGIAIHEAQRMALQADPTFGRPDQGQDGLRAARALAMLTYRTSEQLIIDQTDHGDRTDGFLAASYVKYHGRKFSEQFDALCLYYLTKCIDSHHIGRDRNGAAEALQNIYIPTLVIGFTSDMLVPIAAQRYLAEHLPNAALHEIDSTYGHDGFLKEHEKISSIINAFYSDRKPSTQRVVLKFGGTSLYGPAQLRNVLSIIKRERAEQPIALVVSARGKTTDLLIELYDSAVHGQDIEAQFDALQAYAMQDIDAEAVQTDLQELKLKLEAIHMLGLDTTEAKDQILAYGELMSAKAIVHLLKEAGLAAEMVDARDCLICHYHNGEAVVDPVESRVTTVDRFASIARDTIPVITGYIARDGAGHTVTLGRNGSNLSASLFANYLQAIAVQNWTDVDGIYSADPRAVANAIKIDRMTFEEANELAGFGMKLLHPKTILPLMQANIPLSIRSTQFPAHSGTVIDKVGGHRGIKAVSSVDDVALLTIVGSQLKENIGIDARIFTCLRAKNINVKMVSQASTENGIGLVVNASDAEEAELSLKKEFQQELQAHHMSSIKVNPDIAIIAIIGRHNYSLEKAISTLRKNGIWMHLISNSISGKNISLVVDRTKLKRAISLVHSEVYGTIKTLNVFAIGKGTVGAEFLDQVVQTPGHVIKERKVQVRLIGVCDSSRYCISASGLGLGWREDLKSGTAYQSMDDIIKAINGLYLDDIIIVDNTASQEVALQYPKFVHHNFDIVASNKTFNSGQLTAYQALRKQLNVKGRQFYYETNVGAGLPIMALLRSLQHSSDRVTKIKGVFSGSLSYIFNHFSASDLPFSHHMDAAVRLGYAEPDPRIDLAGMDVGRKLIILAREVKQNAHLEDVEVQNLIPEGLRQCGTFEDFDKKKEELDQHYAHVKEGLAEDEVLRYVAELDLAKHIMKVQLEAIKKDHALAQIKNADNYFEIYTEGYADQPIIIQGAGAGPRVTAQGVYSDVLKIA